MGRAEPDVRPPVAANPSAKYFYLGRMKKFSENTSTIMEVMDANTPNFIQILSFHD